MDGNSKMHTINYSVSSENLADADASLTAFSSSHSHRRKRRRVSGFRARMATKNGQKVLAARKKKGRHSLCPASEKSSAGKKP